ncbi:hypothetical protein B0T19DRAFT_439339 [Cercophora scortea]|uniref:Uncharacterized protein n=1 Tax=Cercophora scortea TaxID=314031 RepID=A0AAE0MH74_9PEZI|nr:hypothetical protein B0T19DRAFT_439339 [Cercophora scortea]
MSHPALRKGLLLSTSLLRPSLSHTPLARLTLAGAPRAASSVPKVAQPSFWKSLVPKPLRPSPAGTKPKKPKSKDWNPATFFIVMFLMVGSMSIQMISLKKDSEAFLRQSDVRIGLLREVAEKIQSGEEVDVEKVLGTGDPEREQEWLQALEEIERDNAARNLKKKLEEEAARAAAAPKSQPVSKGSQTTTTTTTTTPTTASFF